ncbi:MAG TPA: hypothetical protein VEA69_24035 [Tepidisphaeraceae bacterium]|nr:hypothetical protein [Tepidisphaeraceae bacterium]
MGTILPAKRVERLQFVENHVAGWLADATDLGTTSAAITALQGLATSARAAFNAQQVALDLARSRTGEFDAAIDLMTKATTDVLKQIKAKAAIVGGTSIYTMANIPIPATPSPMPPPGTPTDFTVGLTQDGAPVLGWRCANPRGGAGVVYTVARRIGDEGQPYVVVGATGVRSFTDEGVPAGTVSVTYRVIAFRSTVHGPAGLFTVRFGTAESGAATASVVSAPKLAA